MTTQTQNTNHFRLGNGTILKLARRGVKVKKPEVFLEYKPIALCAGCYFLKERRRILRENKKFGLSNSEFGCCRLVLKPKSYPYKGEFVFACEIGADDEVYNRVWIVKTKKKPSEKAVKKKGQKR